MTAGPRRRRHDPLPPRGAGRVEPPAPSTIDLHTHTTRSDGVIAPAVLVGQAFDAGVRLLALTDHDTLGGYREVVAADAVPRRHGPHPRRRDQRDRDPRPRPVGGRAAHPRLRDGPGRRGVRGDARGPARAPARAVRADGGAAARDRPADRRPRPRHLGDRRGRARPADGRAGARSRPGTRRASRTRSGACSAGASPATCRGGARPARGDRGHPRRRRAAGPGPLLARRRRRSTILRELIDAGLAGLEVYYRSFDSATVVAVGEVAAALGLVATGGTDYHGDTRDLRRGPRGLWVRRRSPRAWPSRRVGVSAVGSPQGLTDGVPRQLASRARLLPSRTSGAARPAAAAAAGPQVEGLDEDAEAHRRVDVGLVDVEPEAVGDQRHADQEQEDRASILTDGCSWTNATAAPTRRASRRPRSRRPRS